MTKIEYLRLMSEAFRGLEEYYPELKDRRVKRYIKNQILRSSHFGDIKVWVKSKNFPDERAAQKTYERLRDRIERELGAMEGPREWFPGMKR